MKITRRQLRQIIQEAVNQDTVDLANAGLGLMHDYVKAGESVRERSDRAFKTAKAKKEFSKMRSSGSAINDKVGKYVLDRVTKIKKEEPAAFNEYVKTGKRITIQ